MNEQNPAAPTGVAVDAQVRRLLADMENANAWLQFTTAQANHDLQRYGEWRCDYGQQASIFHADYEKAGRELIKLLPSNSECTDAIRPSAARSE